MLNVHNRHQILMIFQKSTIVPCPNPNPVSSPLDQTFEKFAGSHVISKVRA
jgi:hypothetical protein